MSENTLLLVQVASMIDFADSGWEGGGGLLREVWVQLFLRGLQTVTPPCKTKIVHFATQFKTKDLIS